LIKNASQLRRKKKCYDGNISRNFDKELVADNSTDNTAAIAKGMGAKVIVPEEHDYGNAYRFGFACVLGDYIVMGDGDNTYD